MVTDKLTQSAAILIIRLLFLLLAFSPCFSEGPTTKHLKLNSIDLPKELKREVFNKSHVIDLVLKEEKKWSDDHFVFYHSGSNLFVVQELLKEILGGGEDFHWLRHPNQTKFDSLDALFNQYSAIDDEEKDIRTSLLSVNFSLFGNTGDLDCCTLAYWLQGRRAQHWYEPRELLANLLKLSGRSNEGLEELLDLYHLVQERTLLQIFIPKTERKRLLESFYLSNDQGMPIAQSTGLSPQTQGRLLLNTHLVLNPDSGIKMKRYVFVDKKDKLKIARKKIKEWGQKNTPD